MKVHLRRIGRAAKWASAAVGAAALGFGIFVYTSTESRLGARFDVRVEPLAVDSAPATIARGQHLVTAVAKCTDCHGDDLGGKVMVDDPLAGRLVGPNLTRGSNATASSDEALVRAIVHGVGDGGRPLVAMPARDYAALGREDVAAIVAYVRQAPRVERELPPTRLGPVLRVLLALHKVPLLEAELVDHAKGLAAAPAVEGTATYGAYLARTGGCIGCHGETLAGGPVPGVPNAPPAADLRPAALSRWSEQDFLRAMREGKRPDGRVLDPLMPWRATAAMTDTELHALWLFLREEPHTLALGGSR